jgi:hypothetical protein
MKNRLIAILAILIIVIAACAAPKENTPNAPASENNAPAPSNNVAPENKAPVPESQPAPITEKKSAIADLFAKMPANIEYKVDYDFSSSGPGAAGSGKQIIAIKGKKVKTEVEIEGTKSTTFMMDDKIYTCTTATGTLACYELPKTQVDTSTTDNQEKLKENWEKYDITELPGRTIAGAQTTCFKYANTDGTAEYCYTNEGAPLYIKYVAKSVTTEMTATKYSRSVSDSEFTLPAEPQTFEMPKIPNYP